MLSAEDGGSRAFAGMAVREDIAPMRSAFAGPSACAPGEGPPFPAAEVEVTVLSAGSGALPGW